MDDLTYRKLMRQDSLAWAHEYLRIAKVHRVKNKRPDLAARSLKDAIYYRRRAARYPI